MSQLLSNMCARSGSRQHVASTDLDLTGCHEQKGSHDTETQKIRCLKFLIGELSSIIVSCFVHVQVAAKAQRASVEAAEVFRYEEYNAKHGAKYIDPSDEDAIDTNDWGTP